MKHYPKNSDSDRLNFLQSNGIHIYAGDDITLSYARTSRDGIGTAKGSDLRAAIDKAIARDEKEKLSMLTKR